MEITVRAPFKQGGDAHKPRSFEVRLWDTGTGHIPKSSPYINNRHNHTAAYRMCSGGQQRWKGVGGDDGEQASKQACLTERFHLEATRRKVLTYVPSAKK